MELDCFAGRIMIERPRYATVFGEKGTSERTFLVFSKSGYSVRGKAKSSSPPVIHDNDPSDSNGQV